MALTDNRPTTPQQFKVLKEAVNDFLARLLEAEDLLRAHPEALAGGFTMDQVQPETRYNGYPSQAATVLYELTGALCAFTTPASLAREEADELLESLVEIAEEHQDSPAWPSQIFERAVNALSGPPPAGPAHASACEPFFIEDNAFCELNKALSAAERSLGENPSAWAGYSLAEEDPDAARQALPAAIRTTCYELLGHFQPIITSIRCVRPLEPEEANKFVDAVECLAEAYGGRPYWPRRAAEEAVSAVLGHMA